MASIKKINNSTGRRLIVSLIIGILTTNILESLHIGIPSILIGWDAAAVVFVIWVLLIIWPMDDDRTAKFALREDPSRPIADLILIIASLASLGAVGMALFEAGQTSGTGRILLTALGIFSIIASWTLIHTLYALRYAMLYYSKTIPGSIDFKHDHKPAYSDFLYLAFTVGMTFQVADTDLIGTAFRKTVLKHSLLAYVFGTVIVATTINLIAGLGH